MEYINEGSTLPPPLNIVPTPKGIYVFIKKMLNFIEKRRNMFTLKEEYKPKVNGNLKIFAVSQILTAQKKIIVSIKG